MSDAERNIVTGPAGAGAPPPLAGDVPPALRRRYLSERSRGATVAFYIDATGRQPAFRDSGRRLTTERNDPTVVRDLVAIARHRGWTVLQVRGDPAFRREVWTLAMAAGLEVRGHAPSERDRQALARRLEPRGPSAPPPPEPEHPLDPDLRRRIAEAVVRARIVEPQARDRVLEAVRRRLFPPRERATDARER